ncbi:MAG TPA: ABC transporter permease [Candidatus Limnocylindrales bacterium]|nr:ABC transporter permease [Candidatus Limnocylindrales bacterium]
MSSTSSTISSIRVSGSPSPAAVRLRTVRRALRTNPLMTAGMVLVIVWITVAILAPVIAPFDPLAQNVANRLQPPNGTHWFGTDELGRDLFTRVLYGGRITIPAGLLVVIIGGFIGVGVGAVAGFLGGIADEIIMRLSELFMAFPTIILAMAVTAALGPDIRNAIIALVIVWWPQYARLVRGQVLRVKSQEYVEAAECIGASRFRILVRTVLPNTLSPVLVMLAVDVGAAVLTFAGLSFLGLGPEPSSPEWGRMVSVGVDYFDQWWTWLFAGLAIALMVIAFNFIGDGLRDLNDPRLR